VSFAFHVSRMDTEMLIGLSGVDFILGKDSDVMMNNVGGQYHLVSQYPYRLTF
jgi:hypothetical protein